MIRIFHGLLGSGKTTCMVEMARQDFLDRCPQVYTDMRSLRFPEAVYFDVDELEELARLSDGLIIFDELLLAYDSRRWQSIPRSVVSAFVQLRKNGLNMYGTAQHPDRVESTLRGLVNEWVRCRNVGAKLFWMVATADPEGKEKLWSKWLWRDRRTFMLFETLEILGRSHDERLGRSRYLDLVRRRRSGYRDDDALMKKGKAFGETIWKCDIWDDRVRKMSEKARLVAEEMRQEGRLLSNELLSEVEQVLAEIERRNWLEYFGLKHTDVPTTCTIEQPFMRGWGPDDRVYEEREEKPKRRAAR